MALPEHFQDLSLSSEAGGGLTDPNTSALSLPSGDALRAFLEQQGEAVDSLLAKPYVAPPKLDTSRPLRDYFISSSHNTYLLANQLTGKSDASAYASVIQRNARCVEIDAWADTDLGPPHIKVTHGWTLTSRLPIKTVLDAILAAFRASASDLPVVVSLENHTKDDAFQRGMVDAFHEVLGDVMVAGEREEWREKGATLADFKGKIFFMVEYHGSAAAVPKEGENGEASSSSSDDESDDDDAKQFRKEKKASKGVIGPALQSLGFYAASIKPGKGDGWLFAERAAAPANPLINIEESALLALVGKHSTGVVARTKDALMRVYPKGLRVFSHNLDPLAPWRHGAQVVALNFQTFDRALQFNEAMFAGSGGWVLKPDHLLSGAAHGREALEGRKQVRVGVTLGGLSGLSSLYDKPKDLKPYCEVKLYHSSRRHKARSKSVPVDKGTDAVVWDQHLGAWDVEDDDLIFIRFCLFDDERLKEDPSLGVFTARLSYVRSTRGWGLVRPLDAKGEQTALVLAVRITQDAVQAD